MKSRALVFVLVLVALVIARSAQVADRAASGDRGSPQRSKDSAAGSGQSPQSASVRGQKRRPQGAKLPRRTTPNAQNSTPKTEGRAYGNTPSEILPYRRLVRPYKDFFAQPQEFLGTGREEPEPKVATVRIGFLGPLKDSPEAVFGRHMLQGARLAVERANAAGGYRGVPFELIVHEDKARWGDSSNEMVKMFHDEKVWGILGTLSSANAHVMLRATLKMNIPIVNPATTDPTLNEHRIPFGVRVMADDRQFCYALALHLFRERKLRWVAMMRVNNRDGRVGVREFIDAARRLGNPLLFEVRFEEGDKNFASQLERIRKSPAEAVVVWGNPREAGLIVKQMRQMGMKQAVVGWFRMVSPEFLKIAGTAAEGLVCAYPYDPTADNPLHQEFQRRYQRRFGAAPDAFAAHAYDGMNLLIAAIRKAGLNRIRIRDALAEFKMFRGVTGDIIFDATHNDIGPVYLAKVECGTFRFGRARLLENGQPQATVGNGGKRQATTGTTGNKRNAPLLRAPQTAHVPHVSRRSDTVVGM